MLLSVEIMFRLQVKSFLEGNRREGPRGGVGVMRMQFLAKGKKSLLVGAA